MAFAEWQRLNGDLRIPSGTAFFVLTDGNTIRIWTPSAPVLPAGSCTHYVAVSLPPKQVVIDGELVEEEGVVGAL